MAENVTRVTLPQLADLSLNCPDLGTLNFNILHILLQVLIKQVQRDDVTVEFRGKEAEKIKSLINAAKPGPSTNFSEYNVTGGPDVKKSKSKDKKLSLTDVQSGKKDAAKSGSTTVVVVEPPGTAPSRHTISIDKTVFDHMKHDIKRMQTQIQELVEMPGNLGLIDATKDSKSAPMLEMFQMLTLKKRMDANEAGVEKVVTLLEDVVKAASGGGLADGLGAAKILNETAGLKTAMSESDRRSSTISTESKITAAGSFPGDGQMTHAAIETYMRLEQRVAELEEAIQLIGEGKMIQPGSRKDSKRSWGSAGKSREASFTDGGGHGGGPGGGEKYDEDEYEVDEDGNKKKKCAKTFGVVEEPSLLEGQELADLPEKEALSLVQAEIQRIVEMIHSFNFLQVLKDIDELQSIRLDGPKAPPDVKITRMETKFTETVNQMNNLNTMYSEQLTQVREQIAEVQHEVSNALDKMNMLLPGGDSSGLNEQGIIDLYNKFMQLREEMNVIANLSNKLLEEKETIVANMEGMLEQIDLLKIVKANREDLEEALGDKADACAVNRKVSHDQFDQACDDLSKGLEDALEKLTQQEAMWSQALDDIQREIGSKLDKMEVEPLRDFVNQKLKGLHDKFKKLSHLKQETEAAGTRNKLLRNVNCISCDKDVVMRREMDPSLKPKQFAMQPTRNMAPYLAYELDQLRKQQKCIPGGKNLQHYENAIKGMKAPKEKDHICNRYCGGSHTVTTPQQRVTRIGHFLEQYGPDVAPMGGDEFVKGNDNKMYKAREPPTDRSNKSAGQKDAKRTVSSELDVTKDQADRMPGIPIPNKLAEEILDKEAGDKPKQKTSMEILPTKLSSGMKLGPKEVRGSVTNSLASKAEARGASATGSLMSKADGGAPKRGSMEPIQEKASVTSNKHVSVGPEEGQEG